MLFLALLHFGDGWGGQREGGVQARSFVLASVMNCKVNRLQAIMLLPRSSLCWQAVDNVRTHTAPLTPPPPPSHTQLQTSVWSHGGAQQSGLYQEGGGRSGFTLSHLGMMTSQCHVITSAGCEPVTCASACLQSIKATGE